MKKTILFTLILLIAPALVLSMPGIKPKQAVWDANDDADLAGYYLYWGAEGTFNDTDRVDVGNVTVYDVSAVPGPKIAVTAYDTSENESDFSNTVPLDGTAPTAPSGLRTEPLASP